MSEINSDSFYEIKYTKGYSTAYVSADSVVEVVELCDKLHVKESVRAIRSIRKLGAYDGDFNNIEDILQERDNA